MATYCVCLDTNVLSDLVRLIEAGESPKWWGDLRGLVEAGQATLLVPEITLLELETVIRDTDDKITREIAQLPGKVSDRSLKTHLKEEDPLKDWRTKIVQGWKAEAEKIEKFLRSRPESVIEYTAEIAHRAKKRLIAGRHPRPPLDDSTDPNSPYKKWLREQDCGIIESLISWFEKKKLDDFTLAFGTRDSEQGDGGFGSVEDGKGSLNKQKKGDEKFEKGVGILDKTFAEGLPPTQLFFRDMEKLVKFVEKKEKPKTLSPEEQALVQEMKLQQEATAEAVKPGGKIFEIVVGDTIGVHDNPPSVTIRGQRLMPAMRLGGVYRGAYLVQEPEQDDQPFSDTSHVPESAPFPIEGLQTFNASNLGDDEPEAKAQPEDDNPPKPEAEKQP